MCALNLFSVSAFQAEGLELSKFFVVHVVIMLMTAYKLVASFFSRWRLLTALHVLESMRAEYARMERQVGSKAQSIWQMTKEQLIEIARRELNMPREEARRETVITLREKIRSQRKVINQEEHPVLTLPKGLSRMTKEELAHECRLRGIEPTITERPQELKTRAEMLVLIRWLVEQNTSTSATASPSVTPTPRPTITSQAAQYEEDWDTYDRVSVTSSSICDWRLG